MDSHVAKALHDKLYDKRKAAALEYAQKTWPDDARLMIDSVERLIRDSLNQGNNERISQIVDQLCHDYAYAVHQPYARNGGLIGLAAASIALGPEVARYLEKIVPPVLACFTDQDARVRYYACESMYNIAKTSKGEILPFFNEVFDALAKVYNDPLPRSGFASDQPYSQLSADSEMSVKNGAELLDRLIKDIVSDSATSYVSIVHEQNEDAIEDSEHSTLRDMKNVDHPTAFSLPRFIPLLQERIYVLNPYSRMFLVQWIKLLDSIPDLELISYLPTFLRGLFRFLNDANQDVVTATQVVLERFLDEIKLIANLKREIAQRKPVMRDEDSPPGASDAQHAEAWEHDEDDRPVTRGGLSDDADDEDEESYPDWIPGQDVHVDFPQILDILIDFLREAPEEHILLTALRWIDSFFDICPDDMLRFVPRLLNQVLPALSSDIEQVRMAGSKVNKSLSDYIMRLPNDEEQDRPTSSDSQKTAPATTKDLASNAERKDSIANQKCQRPSIAESGTNATAAVAATAMLARSTDTPPPPEETNEVLEQHSDYRPRLDYEGCISALTMQFLNENEATRIAALSWLIMLQQKSPKHVLAAHDGTFPALLKTLSDSSDTVVMRDIQLLAQISRHSDDEFFRFFVVNLLKLLSSDRYLLNTRSNMIIKQLCRHLSAERLYRIMADCLEMEEDLDFANQMVQHLNNNLIVAPETNELRKKLRNWESRVSLTDRYSIPWDFILILPQDGQTLFVALFKAWCNNAVATVCLSLLAQGYEQAYHLIQTFADIEMSVEMLAQVDKLVQLLESPVFTCKLTSRSIPARNQC